MGATTPLSAAVAAVERQLGARVWVHARDLSTGDVCGHDASAPVVSASVFKLPVLVEAALQMHAGVIDPAAPIRVPAEHRRTLGGTGLSVVSDDVSMSFRDLVLSMMSVSDNRATDIVMDIVGLDAVAATLERLGLPHTAVPFDCDTLWSQLVEDLGDIAAMSDGTAASAARIERSRPLDPMTTNRTTAAESTELLRAIWHADGIPRAASDEIRRILGLQVWYHRLSSGFPEPGVALFGKTGTIGPMRNEVGVIEDADGGRWAAAVFIHLPDATPRQPDADRAIGTLGRAAVDTLRQGEGRVD